MNSVSAEGGSSKRKEGGKKKGEKEETQRQILIPLHKNWEKGREGKGREGEEGASVQSLSLVLMSKPP